MLLLRFRYGNKHPKMEVRVDVDSRGNLSAGQCLGVEVSLMPGYDLGVNKSKAFNLGRNSQIVAKMGLL